MTIVEAIKQVLRDAGRPLTHAEIYEEISLRKLYEFHTDTPAAIVRSQIRRHCVGLDFPSASRTKHFEIVDGNKYRALTYPILSGTEAGDSLDSLEIAGSHLDSTADGPQELPPTLDHVRSSLAAYLDDFTNRMLADLRALSPREFEIFAKRMLIAYGFKDVDVTGYSRDGGIDGYGELKMGLGTFTVAFQCKRYRKGKIHRPAIDAFRGAIQGRAAQGIFFTTSTFSVGALADSRRAGAMPVVLVDGKEIVNLMIKNNFGVQVENLAVPVNALDLVLTEDRGEA